jgi:hypothetical protein
VTLDEHRLSEIRAMHASSGCDEPVCWECSELWPCATVTLLAEVRRLQIRLTDQEHELIALRAELAVAEKALAYRYRQSEGRHQLINELADTKKFLESEWAKTRAELSEVAAERDKAVRVAVGLEHDYAAANAEREEMRERGDRIYDAFVTHRTATHEVKPTFCTTCRESTAALDAYRASGPKA